MLQKCRVKVLQESTDSSDVQKELTQEMKDHLSEIYRIRRQQERYERNEIGKHCNLPRHISFQC